MLCPYALCCKYIKSLSAKQDKYVNVVFISVLGKCAPGTLCCRPDAWDCETASVGGHCREPLAPPARWADRVWRDWRRSPCCRRCCGDPPAVGRPCGGGGHRADGADCSSCPKQPGWTPDPADLHTEKQSVQSPSKNRRWKRRKNPEYGYFKCSWSIHEVVNICIV